MSQTLGILGGGQLGRMLALSARRFGGRVLVLDPDPHCPAAAVADEVVVAPFADVDAACQLAKRCDVVTLEFEHIDPEVLAQVEGVVPMRPSASVLRVIQNKARQKEWLVAKGFPVGPFGVAEDAHSFRAQRSRFVRAYVKAALGGYDGRGQQVIEPDTPSDDLPLDLGFPVVIEEALDLRAEFSVLVARRANGDQSIFPAAENHHERQVLAWSVLPARLPTDVTVAARELAAAVARQLGIVGLLAVEFFWTKAGKLFINELAPRPHNSFHGSERACSTSQFEQAVRAVGDWPLGAVDIITPCAIHNVLGADFPAESAAWSRALADPSVTLHVYGKSTVSARRKMAHLSAIGRDPSDALLKVQAAFQRLRPSP